MHSASGAGLSLAEIAANLGGELRGDPTVRVKQIAPLASAGEGQIAFIAQSKYRKLLESTAASALILDRDSAALTDKPCLIVRNPYAYYARVAALLNPVQYPVAGVAQSAVSASPIPDSCSIGAQVSIGREVHLGNNVVIHPGCVLGDGVVIGDNTVLMPRVTIYRDCQIGQRCLIHAGAVIGADGFGFAPDQGQWVKIPQIGRVLVGDDVEIGANTTIDRGALDDTIIGEGTKLDNQIQIGHNCVIGAHCVIAACTGIAGSARIGDGCAIGGAAMILGHLEIAAGSVISPGSMVMKSITKPGKYTALYPLEAHDRWLHNAAQIRHLDKLAQRVSELEAKLEKINIRD